MGENRHIVTESIILHTYIFREIDRTFTFLSKDIGINRSTAFGAFKLKSRFCSTIQPFVKLVLNLYHNSKDNSYKLEDISYVETNDFIKEDIYSIYVASFFVDLISSCLISPDEYKRYFYLLDYSLELLKEKRGYYKSFLFFTSKFLFLSGYNPTIKNCSICKHQSQNYFFDIKKGAIFCEKCTTTKKYIVSKETIQVFEKFLIQKYIILKDIILTDDVFKQLYPILIGSINNIFEKKLKTLDNLNIVFK